MTAFAVGTTHTFTLDEWDQLEIFGKARLTVEIEGQSPFDTETYGTQIIGPFGHPSTIEFEGLGVGTYAQVPSNIPSPLYMVDISAAQQAAPTAEMLALTNVFYQLNAAPFTVYRSNGTALETIAVGGGVSSFTDLDDAATAPIATTNTSVAAVKTTADAAAASITSLTTTVDGKAPGGTLVTYTGTGRNLASTDNGNVVRCTYAGPVTMTVPSGLTNFSCILVDGSGQGVTVAQGLGVTLTAKNSLQTAAQEQTLAIVPTAADAYTVYSEVTSTGVRATVSQNAPVSPAAGDRWVSTLTGIQYTYISTGANAWVEF